MKNLFRNASEKSHRFVFHEKGPENIESIDTLSELSDLKKGLSEVWKKEAEAGDKPDVAKWEGIHQVDGEVMRRTFHIQKVDGGYVVEMNGTGVFSDEKSEVFQLEDITTDLIDKKVQNLLDEFRTSETARVGTKIIDNEGMDITDIRRAEQKVEKAEQVKFEKAKAKLKKTFNGVSLPSTVPSKFQKNLTELKSQKGKITTALNILSKNNIDQMTASIKTYVDGATELKNAVKEYMDIATPKAELLKKLKAVKLPDLANIAPALHTKHATLLANQAALEEELGKAGTVDDINTVSAKINAHIKAVEAFKKKAKPDRSTDSKVDSMGDELQRLKTKIEKYKGKTLTIDTIDSGNKGRLIVRDKNLRDTTLRLHDGDTVKIIGKSLVQRKDSSGQERGKRTENGPFRKHYYVDVEVNGETYWVSTEFLLKLAGTTSTPVIVPNLPGQMPPGMKPPTTLIPGQNVPTLDQNDHLVAGRIRPAGRLTALGNQQFDEQVRQDLSARHLINSYEAASINGLLQAIEQIPVDDRPKILSEFFATLGQEDPKKAAEAMKALQEIITQDKGQIEAEILKTFDEKIKTAPTQGEKLLWTAQKTLFEISQGKLTPIEAEGKMRLAYRQLKDLSIKDLTSAGAAEMHEGLLSGLENNLRQNVALDMVLTSYNTLNANFQDHEDLAKFEGFTTSQQRKELENKGLLNNLDTDEEAFFASEHVYASLIYLIQHQYPHDVAAGIKITNPVDHYLMVLKDSNGVLKKPYKDAPTPPNNFVAFDAELKLFQDYQSGNIDMGHSSIWDIDGDGEAFGSSVSGMGMRSNDNILSLTGHENKGLYGLSNDIFGTSDFLESSVDLGAVEKLKVAKIKNAYQNGHYDEARALCIETLKDSVPVPTEIEILEKQDALAQEQGSKISAQVRLMLEGQGITQSNIATFKIAKEGGGFYVSLRKLIEDKSGEQLRESAIIELYGEKLSQIESSKLKSPVKKKLLAWLNDLNGVGKLDLKPETTDVITSVAKTVAEIVIVEAATMGTGSFIAAGVGATRVASVGARTMRGSRAMRIQGMGGNVGQRAGAKLNSWVTGSRLASNGAARSTGRFMQQRVGSLANPTTRSAKATQTILHSTAFVEGTSMMHGEFVDPTSAEGLYQIGTMASTFFVLGKLQQAFRGETLAAQKVANGTANWAEQNLLLGNIVNKLGNASNRVAGTGRLGMRAVSTGEFAAELGAFHYLASAQEELAVMTNMMSETERQAMAETNDWARLGHEAGVLLGLRTWRKVGTHQRQIEYKPERIQIEHVPRGQKRKAPGKPETVKSKLEKDLQNYRDSLNKTEESIREGKLPEGQLREAELRVGILKRKIERAEGQLQRRKVDTPKKEMLTPEGAAKVNKFREKSKKMGEKILKNAKRIIKEKPWKDFRIKRLQKKWDNQLGKANEKVESALTEVDAAKTALREVEVRFAGRPDLIRGNALKEPNARLEKAKDTLDDARLARKDTMEQYQRVINKESGFTIEKDLNNVNREIESTQYEITSAGRVNKYKLKLKLKKLEKERKTFEKRLIRDVKEGNSPKFESKDEAQLIVEEMTTPDHGLVVRKEGELWVLKIGRNVEVIEAKAQPGYDIEPMDGSGVIYRVRRVNQDGTRLVDRLDQSRVVKRVNENYSLTGSEKIHKSPAMQIRDALEGSGEFSITKGIAENNRMSRDETTYHQLVRSEMSYLENIGEPVRLIQRDGEYYIVKKDRNLAEGEVEAGIKPGVGFQPTE